MIRRFLRRPRTGVEFLADAVRVVGLISVIAAAVWWRPTDAGILALCLPALLVPRFLGVRAWFDAAYGVTVLIAAWSNVLGLYEALVAWDLVVHFVCTGVIAGVAYLALARTGLVEAPATDGRPRRTPLVLVPALGLAVSALWEMIEWLGYAFITDDIFVTYQDTIADMAAGGLGAVAAGLLVAWVPLLRPDEPVNPLRDGVGRT